jgi:hypothetical protein
MPGVRAKVPGVLGHDGVQGLREGRRAEETGYETVQFADGGLRMAIDWAALRVEYVNSALTYGELAEKHGIKAGTVRQRANRECWNDSRNALSQFVTTSATEQITDNRVDELTKFNQQDLETAKAIRNKAIEMMGQIDTPSDLRALAGAVDVAQKVGRLALGASTENSAQVIRELPTLEDDGWLG